jgi:hypothetical protein
MSTCLKLLQTGGASEALEQDGDDDGQHGPDDDDEVRDDEQDHLCRARHRR